MNKVRVMPVLLLRQRGLEKGVKFRDFKYVGCPVNAARVFNRHNVDELVLLDTCATAEGRGPVIDIVREIARESFMPFTVGGGIRSVDMMWDLLQAGADRVVLNTAAMEHPDLIAKGADRFGRQCMVVSIDARRRGDGWEVCTHAASQPTGLDPVAAARDAEAAGAGEILITSIDRDGTLEGYDVDLIRAVSSAVSIPVIACGGAGTAAHLAAGVYEGGASAVAAGAFFLFYGKRRTVLITYPTDDELRRHFRPEHVRPKDVLPAVTMDEARL
jgi:cyclase